MAKVKQEFTGDARRLLREYEKMREEVLKLQQGQQRLVDQSARGAKGIISATNLQTSAAQKFRTSITGMITGYASATQALALLNAETERQHRLAEAARLTNVSVGDAQAAVIKNIGDVTDEQARSFLEQVGQVQRDSKFQSQVPLLQAASSILSATGGDQDKTLEILRQAAPFFRDQQEELASFGGALGDVMRVTGDDSAKRNLGLMLAIQGQARFEDLEAFKNVAPALASAGVTQPGVDKLQATREAAALFAAIGGRSGDVEGSRTKTAVSNLAANLQKAFPEEGLSVLDRLAKAQQASPEVQAEVLKSGFEGAIRPIIEELVKGADSQTSKMTQDALAKIVTSEEFVDRKRGQLESLTGALETATRSRTAEGNVEAFELGVGGDQATTRMILQNTLEKLAGDMVSNKLNMMRFDYLGEADPERAIAILLEEQDRIMYGGISQLGLKDSTQLTPKEEAQMVLIGEQIQILADIREGVNRSQSPPPPRPGTHVEND